MLHAQQHPLRTCVAKSGVTGDASSARDGNVTLDRTDNPTDDAVARVAPIIGPGMVSEKPSDGAAACGAAFAALATASAVASPFTGLSTARGVPGELRAPWSCASAACGPWHASKLMISSE
jgi:hypothetical protein